ncbi:MAG: hypothetical protein DRR19_01975 [Candidatus Parabeggiatoa sp. nov. 1]|nr:MAG: hypothetical protein DRR19_01975 [Gammaproteobacteria bacterium]
MLIPSPNGANYYSLGQRPRYSRRVGNVFLLPTTDGVTYFGGQQRSVGNKKTLPAPYELFSLINTSQFTIHNSQFTIRA